MTIATLTRIAESSEPEYHNGDPIYRLAPGDSIPTERMGPFAVLISPDLASYLLTMNRVNRGLKQKVAQFAEAMRRGLWRYPSEALHFRTDGLLGNGQNRLHAVVRSGIACWFRVEFGWPDESFDAMDQGSPRSTADVLRFHGVPDPNTAGATLSLVARYDETAGSARSWMNSQYANFVPGAVTAEAMYTADETAFRDAVRRGNRLYGATDKGLTRSIWAAAYYICARKSPTQAVEFFGSVENGAGGSEASRALREHAMRRTLKSYRTGDRREPLENILRAFQAFQKNTRPGFVRTGGFRLTLIR